jgi:hypothetical protein
MASAVVRGTPLRQVVASCLEKWGVTSEDESDESDEFCGWRVGSRCEAAEAASDDLHRHKLSMASALRACCLQ